MSAEAFPYLSANERRSFQLCRQAEALSYRPNTPDGATVDVFCGGPADAAGVVLVNPVGVSCLFFSRLAARLAERLRVVTWERRGFYPGVPQGSLDGEAVRAAHREDLRVALDTAGIEKVHAVVAYCSGCYGALLSVLEEDLGNPQILCLVSPPLEVSGLDANMKTMYQNTFVPLLERIAESGPRMAGLVRSIMAKAERPRLTGVDGELARLNELPFVGADETYRYALLHHAWRSLDWDVLLQRLQTPTLILHGTSDEIVHEHTVRSLCRRLPNAQLELYEGEGHFAVHQSDALIDSLAAAVNSGTCRVAMSSDKRTRVAQRALALGDRS